ADVVLIARDSDLVDHLLALASAAELSAEVLSDPNAAALVWTRVPLIVVGVDVLESVVRAAPPRRAGVVVFGPARAEHWRMAFELGADRLVDPPGEPGWLAECLSRSGEEEQAGRVVGVMGCRGGAGASVFASALAVAGARQRLTPYLLDLDPLGCGLGVVLGADALDGLTWDQVRAGAGRIPARSLQSTIANVAGIGVLGWADETVADLPVGVAGAVVDAARRCTPVTVLDVGRGTTDFQHEAMARCDRLLMVVPADVRSVRAARRTAHRLGPATCEVVVRGPNPGGLTGSDVAEAVGLPVLAAVSADRGLDTRLERGEPPGLRRRSPLGRAGAGVLAEVLA
ncbi:MAG TPA: hypothetical protein PLT68_10150, partial [Actinomycetota bacterium]|nr:hypothetical protein [Actinomycetota bacterium]